jgi:hypothetical protein
MIVDRWTRQRLPHLFNGARLTEHFAEQLSRSRIVDDPMPHVRIEHVLPDDVYAALLRWLPPVGCFSTNDRIMQNVELSTLPGCAPPATTFTWPRLEREWMPHVVRPALMQQFARHVRAHYVRVFGRELADEAAMSEHEMLGRFTLRRPGYLLKPHRDPLTVAMTVLWYVARPGDDEAYGTQLYRVTPDVQPDDSATFYPPPETCTLVKTVPFRPNTMLAFINSLGAHAAEIPRGAAPTVERYSYQTHIRLPESTLLRLLRKLPSDAQERWRGN